MALQIPESQISNYDFPSVNLLYSNAVGIPILLGKEQFLLTGQPIALISRTQFFEKLFAEVDFRYGPIVIFEDSELSGNLKSLTGVWNYINGALEPLDTFKKLSYTELIQMLPFITDFRIKSKEFYDSYLKALTGFSTYTSYDVSLMRSSIPKLIIDLDDFFNEDRSLSNYWKQKLALGLANLEGPNPNLASISIKPIKTERCEELQKSPAKMMSTPTENIVYVPTLKSPSNFVSYTQIPQPKNNF
jgi:hypothetical protein